MSNKINVGIIGIGNCASSLVQGVYFYRDKPQSKIGNYNINDINFSLAIDVDSNKVGKDLSSAIFAYPNNSYKFSDVPNQNVKVLKGKIIDSIGKYSTSIISVSDIQECDIVSEIKKTKTDILINYLPVGSEKNTIHYVEKALEAKCAVINAIPVFIASNDFWNNKFKENGIPIIGDDIKSQFGATILNRTIVSLMSERGIDVENIYQTNFGGNMDFCNMQDRDRLKSKKISKESSVISQLPASYDVNKIHVSPSDYIQWLEDKKICHLKVTGKGFGNMPIELDLKLEVQDSPNSAGVMIDAIRILKIAIDNKLSGALEIPSSVFMKTPPIQMNDFKALKELKEMYYE